jgi:hypothetical protein
MSVSQNPLEAFAGSEPLTPAMKALADEPVTLRLLSELRDAEERVTRLRAHIESQSEEIEQLRTASRSQFRKINEKRFADVDYRKALVGAPVAHEFRVAGATYSLALPTAAAQHAVQAFALDDQSRPLRPITPVELQLLASLTKVALGAAAANDLSRAPMVDKLTMMRQLPAIVLNRLADEAQTLETWLSVVLEDELGNS